LFLQVTIKFGTRVDDLEIEDGHVLGVMVSESADELRLRSQKLECDAVILAVGHSARDVYQMLLTHNVELVPKDFAVSLLRHYLLIFISIYGNCDACLSHFLV
jgi:uncharacterized FAD-dependent dehydrogenase